MMLRAPDDENLIRFVSALMCITKARIRFPGQLCGDLNSNSHQKISNRNRSGPDCCSGGPPQDHHQQFVVEIDDLAGLENRQRRFFTDKTNRLRTEADEDAEGLTKVQERLEVNRVEMPRQVNTISYFNPSAQSSGPVILTRRKISLRECPSVSAFSEAKPSSVSRAWRSIQASRARGTRHEPFSSVVSSDTTGASTSWLRLRSAPDSRNRQQRFVCEHQQLVTDAKPRARRQSCMDRAAG